MQNEQHIWNWLKQCSGLNDCAIAAIMGNIEAESAGIPNNVEDRCSLSDEEYTKRVDSGIISALQWETDEYGYGLCQWTLRSRKKNLLEFAKQKGVSISDIDMQLEFLIKELMNSFKTVWNCLLTANSIATPSDRFLKEFENPADKSSEVVSYRYGLASAIYNRNHGKDATSSTASTTTTSTTSSIGSTVSTSSGSSTCTVSLPVFKKGSNGLGVRALQGALIQRGCKLSTYGVDGDFGSETENAIKLFQASAKITADGIVGAKTYEALFK